MDIIQTVSLALKNERDVVSIGKSVCGNDILCAHRGDYDGKQIIITAAIHARECYTALVVLEQLRVFGEYSGGGAYFVPLVNPDGALFFESGNTQGSRVLERFKNRHRQWKANADGVDLNCNFDANWGTGAQNKRVIGSSDYIGEYPNSAREVEALVGFTDMVKPAATVSYHCMGGELYWEFFQNRDRRSRDESFASAVANKIEVKKVDGDLDSAGGYKDYCVQKLGIPAVTAELIRSGKHPFKPSDFTDDIRLNADLPKFILDYLNGREYERSR